MMKKFMIIMLALLMFIAPAQAQAAAKINLAIDGLVVPSERVEGNNTSFHLEARPQMRSNSVFVPVRVVSEILGADVSWENPNINIKYEDMTINLTVGSRTAYKGEQKITLPAAPYVRSGYTYVPIRFVAEAFDCDVEWQSKKNLVNIQTRPWELNGQEVVGVVFFVNSNTHALIYPMNSPYMARQMYQKILALRGEEVAAPENYGTTLHKYVEGTEAPNFYYQSNVYYFLIDEDNAVSAPEVYHLMSDSHEIPNPDIYLLHMDGKWYDVAPDIIEQLYGWVVVNDYEQLDYYRTYNVLE